MNKPIFTYINGQQNTTTADLYICLEGGYGATPAGSALANANTPMPIPGTFRNLYYNVSAAPGAGTSWSTTFYLNSASQALTASISDTNTTATPDLTHTVPVVAGDLVCLDLNPTNTPANVKHDISLEFAATNSGETLVSGHCDGNTYPVYTAPNQRAASAGTEATRSSICPCDFTLDKLYSCISAAPGTGRSFSVTVYKNGVATALTASFGAADTLVSDLTHSVSFAKGDTISFEVALTASTAVFRNFGISCRVVPTVSGENPLFGTITGGFSAGSTVYGAVIGANAISTGESTFNTVVPGTYTLKKFNMTISAAPGTGKSFTMQSRKNSANGNITFAIANTATSGEDGTNTDSLVAGDMVDFSVTPAGTPTVGQTGRFGFVASSQTTTTTAITKSLTYQVLTTHSITKSLTYQIKRTLSVTKSLLYRILTTHSITKSLAYLVKRANSITKSLAYKVLHPISLAKSLVYMILHPASLTKSLKYAVKKTLSITKSLAYAVRHPISLTKSLIYAIKKATTVTKSLQYAITTGAPIYVESINLQLPRRTFALTQKDLSETIQQPRRSFVVTGL